MVLKVLGSGSSGNCYILENDAEALVIEAGLPFLAVKKALDFNISKIVGVVISHSHQDHAKYAGEYEKAGIPVWRPWEIMPDVVFFGKFNVEAFELVHDVPCFGFYIEHPDMDSLVYATDTEYIKYRFPAVSHILVEANYSPEFLDPSIPHRDHILSGHMALQTTLGFLAANDNPNLMNVVLIHLSDRNSVAAEFGRKAQSAVRNCPVWIARPGLVVKLGKDPF